MDSPSKPNEALAIKVLPEPLLKSIRTIFSSVKGEIALVGGTALSGFYAGHRRSDDIDIFTANEILQKMAVQSIKNLSQIGLSLRDEFINPGYYHGVLSWNDHIFTADVVLDPHIHKIGTFFTTPSGIRLPDLETLLMMKAATLVSRCSEKDLYDLWWLTEYYRRPSLEEWISLGSKIDAGFTGESLLMALVGAKIRIEACSFSELQGVSKEKVMDRIVQFKNGFQQQLMGYLKQHPVSGELAKLLRQLSKIARRRDPH